jgi:hypothetical protein
MRYSLLAQAVAAALTAAAVVPLLAAPPAPRRAESRPVEPERPDRVAHAFFLKQLPFGCPSSCCRVVGWNELAILVQDDAVWIGTMYGPALKPPLRVPRDGHEWEALVQILAQFPKSYRRDRSVQLAVDDSVPYEDLLRALVAADDAGLPVIVVEPALPVYPHHGTEGGLPHRYN